VEATVGYLIEIDHGNCINCGICMDVCPVEALDMSRPQAPGPEASPGVGPIPWLMEHPIQVGECVGCTICVRECPVAVITLTTTAGPTPLAPRQGPVTRPVESPANTWIPLSSVTRESLKRTKVSPFDGIASWRSGHHRAGPAERLPQAHGSEDAPCQAACPAGTDAGRYVGLVAAGRYDDAYAVAAEVNPFPSVCGWICTAPCEAACRRGELDEPIAIRGLKRFAVEHGILPPITPPAWKRAERVAIVGGGPAGMSAAYYLARLGYPVTVLEAMPVPGGMMAIGIPAYRLPRETLQAEIARIVALGVELRLDAVMGRDFTLDDLERDYQAVFLATGAPKSRPLDVSGDRLRGVIPATRFLKEVNLGPVPRLTGAVAVVGGGSTAMDAARSAWRCGATSVSVLYRRGAADMPAQPEEVEAARNEGIKILTGVGVTEVVGLDGFVTGLRIISQAPTGELDGGRTIWAPVPGSATELAAGTVLVAIGEEPDPSILPVGAGIEIGASAGIVADARTLATGHKGVFAGGDVVSGPKTIIDAVAAGRRAAGAIHEYLGGSPNGEAEVMATVRYRTPQETLIQLDLAPRARAIQAHPVDDERTFGARQEGFSPTVAVSEASRCFRCDALAGCPTVEVIAGRGPADRVVPAMVTQAGGEG
jgi:NADPH-dependent glutamate synthase beta subunit-like oxidoreductase/Pyruvate/2-oxoacid:ferredoxin oxidoreductase delta subunit